MSTEISSDLVTISIDGKEIQAKPGELLIAAAESAGVFIPRFCYHPRLPQVGMCRMCLVEVKGPRGFSLQPSCYVPVSDGMEVVTESDKVKKAQDGVIEFLLINHPLDCPVCDKGGECPLQDQTLVYGPGESRFIEEKRHFEKPIAISDLVYLDRERCIQCDRCTRFADEIAGDPLIEFIGRGDLTEVNVFPDRPFSSYFSGNTVQICPVGALTATPYRFKARPWDLSQVESSCSTCSMGCRIMVQSSQNEITRYLGLDSEPLNQGWLCDKGRFGYEAINSGDRVTVPLMRKGNSFVETSWANALATVASKVIDTKNAGRADTIGLIAGSRLTNEDYYAWIKLAKSVIGTDSFDSQLGDGIGAEVLASLRRATIDDALSAKAIVAFTGDVKEEIPVLYLRLREAVKSGKTKIVSIGTRSSSLWPLSEVALSVDLEQLQVLAKEILTGSSLFPQASQVLQDRGVGPDGDGLVILLGRENLAWDQSIVEAFALEVSRVAPKAKFLVTLRGSNFAGGVDLGAAPGLLPGRRRLGNPSQKLTEKWSSVPSAKGMGVAEMLKAAKSGSLPLLFLIGSDPRADYVDTAMANAALDEVDFVVSVDTFISESSSHADLILPAAAFSEKAGTTTNLEGRILTQNQKVSPPGLCRPDWTIACEIALELGEDLGFSTPEEIVEEIASVSPLHRGLSLDRLRFSATLDGVVLPISATQVSIRSSHKLDPISIPGIASVWNQGLASSKTSYLDSTTKLESATDQSPAEQLASDSRIELAPRWPVLPSRPSGSLELCVKRKLYDQGEHLKNSPHLAHLVAEAKCYMSFQTLTELGGDPGINVRVIDKMGGYRVFEVEVDDSIRLGVIELVKSTFAFPDFSPIRSDETINYVRVEQA